MTWFCIYWCAGIANFNCLYHGAWQATYKQLIGLDLSLVVLVGAVLDSFQQSLFSEPVSRLFELLLFGRPEDTAW
jgi:hypothetical protein